MVFLLDESLVVQLKRAGVSCVTVSIDSFKEDEHDLSRGEKGSYKRAIKAVENCLKVKIPCVISTIATNDSISSGKLRRVILEAKMMRVNGVRILLPMLSGKWHNKKEYLLSEESWKKLALFFDPGFVYFENGFLTRHNDKFEIVCPAAIKRLIYISPHGFIHPCYTVPYSFGNVKKTRLKEIVNNMWKHPLMKSPPQNVCLINDESYRRLLMDYKEI
ncbi:MAG: radical SAM protein [Candidatus Omnitrophica bacterium]|nr:radical SAM protein [Candidatus Omnitrophota bacterium]